MVILLKKKLLNENGSTLVLLVIVIAVIILMGASLLNITMSQYKIRQSNSEVKRAFYMSETGLNDAYLRVYDLICEASEHSVNKADEYLFNMPEDFNGASLLFKSSYKQYIISNAINIVHYSHNPYTDVVNNVGLAFISENLTLKINSKYILASGIEKISTATIVVSVPDYFEAKDGLVDFMQLVQFIGFNL